MKLSARIFIIPMFLISHMGYAAGMKPDIPTVFLDDEHREAIVSVENTDKESALLHSSVETIPEDKQIMIIATPQLARLEPGKKQLVRVILKNGINIEKQRMQRLNFVSIPKNNENQKNETKIVIGQNIPIIISPKGLPVNAEPWKELIWSKNNDTITVENKSKYIVRLSDNIKAIPSNKQFTLGKRYILPGDKITLKIPRGDVSSINQVEIYPATRFGLLTQPYRVIL